MDSVLPTVEQVNTSIVVGEYQPSYLQTSLHWLFHVSRPGLLMLAMLLNLAFCVLQHSFCSRWNRLCMVSTGLLYNEVSASLHIHTHTHPHTPTHECICEDEGRKQYTNISDILWAFWTGDPNLCSTTYKPMCTLIYSVLVFVSVGVEKGICFFSTVQHPTISITRGTWELKFHLTVTLWPLVGTSEHSWYLFNYTTMFALSEEISLLLFKKEI